MRDVSLAYYQHAFDTMRIEEAHLLDVGKYAQMVVHGKESMYLPAQAKAGVPWVVFGLTHLRECTCNPDCQILNGESWKHRTTLVPAGLGPWPSWADAALECAKRQGWVAVTNWSVPVILAELEQHNGLGYAYKGVNSPYLFSFTDLGRGVGKYVADGRYDPDAVDKQVGVAPVLRALIQWGEFAI